MTKIEELQRELVIHRDIYEIARDKLIETEINLKDAIEEEEELKRAAEGARKFVFLSMVGVAIAAVAISIWA
jgi:predicted translin family RNA/ssDNA-binding protein